MLSLRQKKQKKKWVDQVGLPAESDFTNTLLSQKNELNVSIELHQGKAEMFHQRKRSEQLEAQCSITGEQSDLISKKFTMPKHFNPGCVLLQTGVILLL